jgi:hypothetical protein
MTLRDLIDKSMGREEEGKRGKGGDEGEGKGEGEGGK